MSNQSLQRQQGMALFQVLLMVAIISVLLIIMSQQTQSSVSRAQTMQQQVETQLALESSAAYVDSLLLSNEWLSARSDESHPLHQINFYGGKTSVALPERPAYAALNSQVSLQLQNEASLFDINYRPNDVQQLLLLQGIEAAQAEAMIRELKDYLQRPDAMLIQQLGDLLQLSLWDVATLDRIAPFVSVNAPTFNPVWAPDELLPILLSQGQADTIRSLRKTNEISAGLLQEFAAERDVLDSGIFPGVSQRVLLTSENTGLQLYREVDYRPRHPSPLRRHAKQFRQE